VIAWSEDGSDICFRVAKITPSLVGVAPAAVLQTSAAVNRNPSAAEREWIRRGLTRTSSSSSQPKPIQADSIGSPS
jgi:hypothetical protein